MEPIDTFRERHGLGGESELARKVDLSAGDQEQLRRFFELRSQFPSETEDQIIRRVLGIESGE